jgi:hypothetical protein
MLEDIYDQSKKIKTGLKMSGNIKLGVMFCFIKRKYLTIFKAKAYS